MKIGEGAFAFCSKLEEIVLPPKTAEIGQEAFYDCTGLNKLYIPKSVKIIGKRAFVGLSYIREIELPEGIVSIGKFAVGFYHDKFGLYHKVSGMKIICRKGTVGELYARKIGIEYELVDELPIEKERLVFSKVSAIKLSYSNDL